MAERPSPSVTTRKLGELLEPGQALSPRTGPLKTLDEVAGRLSAGLNSGSSMTPPADSTKAGLDAAADPAGPMLSDSRSASQKSGAIPFERLGHFRMIGRIGQGGTGDVYEGYDDSLDRRVAVKVLPAELARDEDLVLRFHAEAAAAAKIGHQRHAVRCGSVLSHQHLQTPRCGRSLDRPTTRAMPTARSTIFICHVP